MSNAHDTTNTGRFGKATVWSKVNGEWSPFMHLPVRQAADVATAHRAQGREAMVTF